jgi:hypothetical protein
MRKSRKPNHLSSSPHDTYTHTVECTVHKYRSSILVPVAQNRTLSTRTTRSASAESSVRLSGSLRLASLHVPLPTQHDQKKADAFACVHEPRRRTGWWFSVPGSDSCRAPILAPVPRVYRLQRPRRRPACTQAPCCRRVTGSGK